MPRVELGSDDPKSARKVEVAVPELRYRIVSTFSTLTFAGFTGRSKGLLDGGERHSYLQKQTSHCEAGVIEQSRTFCGAIRLPRDVVQSAPQGFSRRKGRMWFVREVRGVQRIHKKSPGTLPPGLLVFWESVDSLFILGPQRIPQSIAKEQREHDEAGDFSCFGFSPGAVVPVVAAKSQEGVEDAEERTASDES